MGVRAWIATIVAVMLPAIATADSIAIVDTSRTVITNASGGPGPGRFTADRQDDRDTLMSTSTILIGPGMATSTATLDSGISSDGRSFSGTGSSTASQDVGAQGSSAGAFTHFGASFTLATPQQFHFVNAFTATGRESDERYSFWRAILLAGPLTENGPRFIDLSGYDSGTHQLAGLLLPGLYEFDVNWSAVTNRTPGSASSDGSFALTLTDAEAPSPTPEPASLVLLATGLAASFRIFRRLDHPTD